MPLIQNPSIGRKLQQRLRLTNLPDSVLAPETVAVILVEDASAPLSDIERGCLGSSAAGAVAAENPIVALVRVGTPAVYNLTITKLWFNSTTDQLIRIIQPASDITGLTVSGNTSFSDFELPGRPTSFLGFDTRVGAPSGRILWDFEVLARTTYMIESRIRLGTFGIGPQLTSLVIAGNTVNTVLRGGFEWTESDPLG